MKLRLSCFAVVFYSATTWALPPALLKPAMEATGAGDIQMALRILGDIQSMGRLASFSRMELLPDEINFVREQLTVEKVEAIWRLGGVAEGFGLIRFVAQYPSTDSDWAAWVIHQLRRGPRHLPRAVRAKLIRLGLETPGEVSDVTSGARARRSVSSPFRAMTQDSVYLLRRGLFLAMASYGIYWGLDQGMLNLSGFAPGETLPAWAFSVGAAAAWAVYEVTQYFGEAAVDSYQRYLYRDPNLESSPLQTVTRMTPLCEFEIRIEEYFGRYHWTDLIRYLWSSARGGTKNIKSEFPDL